MEEGDSNQMEEEGIMSKKSKDRINDTQFYDLITGEEVSWQSIIYDLVKTEQLDPWDINLGVLAEKYLQIIQAMEEANFFVSSKVLLACALLLRLKSEILVNRDIQSVDELLYGKKEEKQYIYERIELDEDELPLLVPRTPMPRYKKVSLQELMSALSKAIDTENRRIKKEIKSKQAEKSALIVMPKIDRVQLKDRIQIVFSKIKLFIHPTERPKMKYSDLAPTKDEKLSCFLPILHLTNQEKLYLDQDGHFEEIMMMLENLHKEMDLTAEELKEEDWPEDKIEREDEIEAELDNLKKYKEIQADKLDISVETETQ